MPALNLHLQPADFLFCDGVDAISMTCGDLSVEGNPASVQFAFVFVSGVGSLSGVEFGVEYDPGVSVLSWTGCTGGLAIPQTGWPNSSTGIALTWDTPQFPSSPDSLVLVGYFTVAAGSEGIIRLAPDSRIGRAEYADACADLFGFDETALGVADVAGRGAGFNPCGVVPGIGEWCEQEPGGIGDGPIGNNTPPGSGPDGPDGPGGFPEGDGLTQDPEALWVHYPDHGLGYEGGHDFAVAAEFADWTTLGVLALNQRGTQSGWAAYELHVYDLRYARDQQAIDTWQGYHHVPLWETVYQEVPSDTPNWTPKRTLICDPEGDFYITGEQWDTELGYVTRTAKVTWDPDQQQASVAWSQVQQDLMETEPKAIAEQGNHIYTIGYRYEHDGTDALVEKHEKLTGSVVWSLPVPVWAAAVSGGAVDDNGNVYVVGSSAGYGAPFIAKVRSDGTWLWTRLTYLDASEVLITAVEMGSDGYIYAAGDAMSVASGNRDALILKFDTEGNQLFGSPVYDAYAWEQIIDTTNQHTPESWELIGDLSVASNGWSIYLVGGMWYNDVYPFRWQEMMIRVSADTGEPWSSGTGHWPAGGCIVASEAHGDTQLQSCVVDPKGGVIATGDWCTPMDCVDEELLHCRRRPRQYDVEPTWSFQLDGPGSNLPDLGLDVAFMRWSWDDDSVYYCSVGYAVTELEPTEPDSMPARIHRDSNVRQSNILVTLFASDALPINPSVSVDSDHTPGHEELRIRSGDNLKLYHPLMARGASTIRIFSTTGRLILERRVLRGMSPVVVDGLRSGVYYVRLETQGESFSAKGLVLR